MRINLLRISLRQRLLKIAIALTIAIALIFTAPTASWAVLQSSQFIERPATLIGPRADSPIPLYLRPAANQPSVGYGTNGSAVTVLEQIASFLPEADQAAAWNHVRLENPPYTEGWVQGRFLSFSATTPVPAPVE
ncbi:MAG: SH3 domain-containing protein [Phormidesmis sp.]